MSQQRSTGDAHDARSPFQKFQDLTRKILTTPKADLMKHAPKQSKGKKK